MENIGARRLHTVMELLLDDLAFEAPELGERTIPITAAYVQERLAASSRTRICPSTCCDLPGAGCPGSQYLCAPRFGAIIFFAFRQGEPIEITAVAACVLLLSDRSPRRRRGGVAAVVVGSGGEPSANLMTALAQGPEGQPRLDGAGWERPQGPDGRPPASRTRTAPAWATKLTEVRPSWRGAKEAVTTIERCGPSWPPPPRT